jgi:hypothetical protein
MKKLSLVALTIGLLLLTGCITVIEKYTINKNGSGTMEYIIDMSEMYEMMATFSDSTEDMETAEIDQSMRDAIPGLNSLDGITNVVLTDDSSKYIAGVKFDFKDVKALNQALAVLFKGKENPSTEVKYVEIKGKTFTRYNLTSDEFNKETLPGTEEIDAETMKMVLESMKYKISVNFAKPVRKVTTLANYTVEENRVTVESNFAELFDKVNILKTIIKTK